MSKLLRLALSVAWVGAMSFGGRGCCASDGCGGGSSGCTIDLTTYPTRSVGETCWSDSECYSRRCFESLCVSDCGFLGETCCRGNVCRGRSTACTDAGVCDWCGGLFGPACPPRAVDGGSFPCGTLNASCCDGIAPCEQPLTCVALPAPADASGEGADADEPDDAAGADVVDAREVGGDANADAADDADDTDVNGDADDGRAPDDAVNASADGADARGDVDDGGAREEAGDASADAPWEASFDQTAGTVRVCLSCGGDGQPCCDRRCAEHLACERDDAGVALCAPCGLRGEPCCVGARCEFGARCAPLDDGFDRCVPADAGADGGAPDDV